MPNWVTTKATVAGPADKLDEFVDRHFKDGALSFETVVPSPPRREDCPDKYILGKDSHVMELDDRPWFNWYTWNLDNWGCKWDCGMLETVFTDEVGVCFSFQTPWAFPEPVAIAMAKMNPDLDFTFEYADEDIGTNCGIFAVHTDNGDVQVDFTDMDGNYEFACRIRGRDYEEFCEEYLEDRPPLSVPVSVPVAALEYGADDETADCKDRE